MNSQRFARGSFTLGINVHGILILQAIADHWLRDGEDIFKPVERRSNFNKVAEAGQGVPAILDTVAFTFT